MGDITTFFAKILCFFGAFWAYALRYLSPKSRSMTPSDDLEVGIPSDIRHFQPPVKDDGIPPVSFPAIPVNAQIHAIDNRSKHRGIQFGPSSTHKLPEDYPRSRSRRQADSISDLLDKFPTPPAHIPLLPPLISRDVPLKIVEKTLDSADYCRSPTISEESTDSSSSGSNSILSTDPSTSISNETANTSVHEIPESVPRTSAIFKVLSSGIDVKDKNIARLTLIHNPETLVFPATNIRGRARSQSLFEFRPKAFPEIYHDVVVSSRQAELQKGDISKDTFSKDPEMNREIDAPPVLDNHISRDTRYEVDVQPPHVEYYMAPIHSLEESSPRVPHKHTPIPASFQVVPAVPKEYVRPFVAPLRIVKKNKVQSIVVPLGPPVAGGPESGSWEQAMDNVLQAFRNAEWEDTDFRNLFVGDDSFISQSSIINTLEDDGGDLDGRGEYNGDCGRRLEDSFDSNEKSVDEMLSILIADLVALKVEDRASVSLSSDERGVSQRIMGVKDEINKVDLPVLRFCDCEGSEEVYEDSYSWTAATDDEDDDKHSQEDDQWSDRLELDDYAS